MDAEKIDFKRIIRQTGHDLCSPMASMRMVLHSSKSIPDADRTTLNTALEVMAGIAHDLMARFDESRHTMAITTDKPKHLVSSLLQAVVEDRSYVYKNSGIKIELDLHSDNALLYIEANANDFKRAITNLMNNAVDAMPGNGGDIKITINALADAIEICVIDNGCGIPEHVLQKIKAQVSVTHGKQNGHGIGMEQVQMMLMENSATFDIVSNTEAQSHGTTITLKFPKAPAPAWMCTELTLKAGDTIVVLDDDPQVYNAWLCKLHNHSEIKLERYLNYNDALCALFGMAENDATRVCICGDYSMPGQDGNMLEVMVISQLTRGVFVTNHYTDPDVQKCALQNCIKILPKDLVQWVPITACNL